MHDLSLISMLATVLAIALVLGWMTQKLGLSPIIGYLLAGIVVGPHTPGFVANTSLAGQLAEIGVILLMFEVGLHFNARDLLRVWRIALPGAIGQSLCAALCGWLIALCYGWTNTAGFILGLGFSVASTVVLMRMLSEQKRLATKEGHISVGWLIVEDILTVIMLVCLPVLALDSNAPLMQPLLWALLKVVVFSLLIFLLGPYVISPFLEKIAKFSTELFTLAIFVLAISVAAIAANVFHVSVALGAFLGGLVVGQSRVGKRASSKILSFRDVFAALFFISVGMLFDPDFIVENPRFIFAALMVVLVVKPLVAVLLIYFLKGSVSVMLTVAIGLAQIGEFSFILAVLGQQLGLLPQAGFDVIVACALISIALNPLLFRLIPVLEKFFSHSRAKKTHRN